MRLKTIGKSILFLILNVLFFINLVVGQDTYNCTCYYLPYNKAYHKLPENNCIYFKKLFNNFDINCNIVSLDNFSINNLNNKNIVILSSYGSTHGLFKDDDYNNDSNDPSKIIPWKDIANIKVDLLIIDACYSGYIFNYNTKSNITITSTYIEPSWNIIDNYGINVSSFVTTFRCIYDDNYVCPVDYKMCSYENMDFATCQLNIILYNIEKNKWTYIKMFPWEYPAIGTAHINGKIFRTLK